jgi:hypothetical protein
MTHVRSKGSHRRTKGLWIWRGFWTALLAGLLLWGGLPTNTNDFLLIALGTGVFLMAIDGYRTWRRSNRAPSVDQSVE